MLLPLLTLMVAQPVAPDICIQRQVTAEDASAMVEEMVSNTPASAAVIARYRIIARNCGAWTDRNIGTNLVAISRITQPELRNRLLQAAVNVQTIDDWMIRHRLDVQNPTVVRDQEGMIASLVSEGASLESLTNNIRLVNLYLHNAIVISNADARQATGSPGTP